MPRRIASPRIPFVAAAICCAASLLPWTVTAAAEDEPVAIQVFLLAGQSNMEGQGVVDLDHPQHYNSGKGTLNDVLSRTQQPMLFRHVKNDAGQWAVRDDVYVRFQTRHGLKRGPLTIGFAGYPGNHHIGPEYQLGHVLGDAIDGPVLLVKTAWGGKSLFKDFRPPSSPGETGRFYQQMLRELDEACSQLGVDFPELAGREFELRGFVWFQGWNDIFDPDARAEYELNLVNLIQDLRTHVGNAELPVVIGETGNGGPDCSDNMQAIRSAQRAVALRPELKRTVSFVSTSAFARPADESPNVGHGHHWFGNAESYFLIGDAFGKSMLQLLNIADRDASQPDAD